MSRYHKAAIDNYLELLKEATTQDLNTPDEDGMTPTLWAAYHGNLEALQLICSRRGDPDRSDIWGNTPLHHAATNGHLAIISFLVSFGANIFALDNEFHTAMDVAASRDHMQCVSFLDGAASQQTNKNAKKVETLKKRATKEAQERVKRCEKVKKKHQSKMDKRYRGSIAPEPSTASSNNMGSISGVNDQFSKLIASDKSGSLTARMKGTLQRKLGKKDTGMVERQGDSNVIFMKQNGSTEKPEFADMFNEQDEDEGETGIGDPNEDEDDGVHESIFQRPGLGKMVFRKNFSMEMGMEPEDLPSGDWEGPMGDDLATLIHKEVFETEEDDGGGFAAEGSVPWNQEEIGLDDLDEETTPLDAFLSSISLMDFAPIFVREKLDLDALMLCADEDLRGIRIQLGPRKKILEAAARHKAVLDHPGILKDTFL
ncbi:ankyrin repeat and SAM domain-containing protein 4B [Alosa sapidissima]|uniref:ankyrin repeat and SAM domain-containing protein 4B n=1 Tax=Alosa sapidissima TaxID=34773 RepID=UPI001C0966EA|nr:ankyrin repeat and SAM domain-containing protein 4B [Alosa sapidissima]